MNVEDWWWFPYLYYASVWWIIFRAAMLVWWLLASILTKDKHDTDESS